MVQIHVCYWSQTSSDILPNDEPHTSKNNVVLNSKRLKKSCNIRGVMILMVFFFMMSANIMVGIVACMNCMRVVVVVHWMMRSRVARVVR